MSGSVNFYNPLYGTAGLIGSSGYVEKWQAGKKVSTISIPDSSGYTKFSKDTGYTYKLYVKPTSYPNAFKYWYAETKKRNYTYGQEYGEDGLSEVMTAKWDSWTVSYNANGGSGAPGSQTKYKSYSLTLSSTKPARTGYTFKGWNTKANGSGTSYAAGASYTGNAALTLYAQWAISTWTVSYNANGGSGAPSAQTKTYGQTLKLSSTKPTRTGYTFKGWATSASGSVAYAAGANYTANGGVTLYAVWQINTWSVAYNANGGSGTTAAQTKTYGKTLTLQKNGFSRDPYNFTGWNTKADGSGTSYAAGASYTGNAALALYAQWKRIRVTVTFDANGGTGAPNAITADAWTNITWSNANIKRAKYLFLGWGGNVNSKWVVWYAPNVITGTTAKIDGTLYAVWEAAYKAPTISNATAVRTNAQGVDEDEGEYGLVTFNWTTSTQVDSTGTAYPVKSVTAVCNGETYTWTPDATQYSGSISHVFGSTSAPLSIEKNYTVTITVTDTSGTSTTQTCTLTSLDLWLDFGMNHGVATGGKIAPDTNKFLLGNDELEVTGKAQFDGNVDVSGSTTAKAVSATSITDSGALTVSGTTTLNGTTNAKALTATSITDTGNLTVSGTGTFGNRATAAGFAGSGEAYLISSNNSDQYRVVATAAGNIRVDHSTDSGKTWSRVGYAGIMSSLKSSGGTSLRDFCYPVGAVYISYVSTSPASLFGGSWTQITGRFLRMANDVNTGGANTHTHGLGSGFAKIGATGSEAKSIGYVASEPSNMGSTDTYTVIGSSYTRSTRAFNHWTPLAGYSNSGSSMPAYQDLYAWRRTA